jgi:peptidoglycan/xylan/chitin deacetylase (PgdA/CDA1 family)
MKADTTMKSDHGSSDGNGRRRLAVLGFHKIGSPPAEGWETWFYISAAAFDRYLRWLEERDWRVISAREFLKGLAFPETLPYRSVLLTFDDGYRSMRHVALPILRTFGFPAVLFVPTGFIGLVNSFDAGIEPEEPICDWDDLLELQCHDVSIQSHGVSHCRFSGLREEDRDRELTHSKAWLEHRLGNPVELFSYPYGDCDSDRGSSLSALRRAGYRAAFAYGGGPIEIPVGDVHRIERIAMGPGTDLDMVLESVPKIP